MPAGTLGTVETINSGRAWHFTVRWKPHTPLAGPWRSAQGLRIMPMECSLNLSEEDLQSFEMATDEDILSPHAPLEFPLVGGEEVPSVDQLNIPFNED